MSAGVEDLSALLDNAYVRMILNNPDHHPAILEAMGLDVREGWIWHPEDHYWAVYPSVIDAPVDAQNDGGVPVLVVRPKGVTT